MRLCVIPARGGSKRIPRKNIKSFNGKPIIFWSIEAALKCPAIDHLIVSTDDEMIADVARSFNAEVPFFRPKSLSDDFTNTNEVMAHAVSWFEKHIAQTSLVCCLYPTAPFVTPGDLENSFSKIAQSDADYCFSMTTYAFPTQRAMRVTSSGVLQMIYPEHLHTRSQDLEERYHDAGQFYWGKPEAWIEMRPILGGSAIPFILPRSRVQDIDTIEDWETAELMLLSMSAKKYL